MMVQMPKSINLLGGEHISRQTWRWLLPFLLIASAIVVVNPYSSIDIALLTVALLILGHLYLKEKLLLVFLLIRPTLDFWRNVNIFTYENIAVNLNAAFALVFFAWSIYWLILYFKKIKTVPLLPWLALLVFLMALSILYSVSPLTPLIETFKFANLAIFFVLSYLFIKLEKIKLSELLTIIIAGAIIPLTAGLLQLLFGKGISTFGIQARIYGTFGHPNVFAFFVLFLLILFIHYSTIKPAAFWRKNKKLKYSTYVFLLVLMIMTYTRAALAGLLIFLIVIGLLKYRKMLAVLITSTVLFYVLFYPLNSWLSSNTDYDLRKIPVIERLTSRAEEADSIEWRRSLIRESLPLIRARLLFGYGYGAFPLVWEANRGARHLWDDSAEAHNDYLRFALELGIIGLLAYLILLAKLACLAAKPLLERQDEQRHLYFLGWILVFIAVSLSDNMLHHTPVMWMMWSYFGSYLAEEN